MKRLRKKNGLKRKQVAEILGIDESTLNRVENGTGAMPKLRAEKLAEIYKCSVKEIFKLWEAKK